MTFILSKQRDTDVAKAFERYRKYLDSSKHIFPPSAFELATSQWYFDPAEHKCPHDGWLETCAIAEASSGGKNEFRIVTITNTLLVAYHDGYIRFYYPKVFAYRLDSISTESGHQDWRFDEFRVSDSGRLVHEIEWCGDKHTAKWSIEADDVQLIWMPLNMAE